MLVSPADFQAFAEATGTPYPSTGADKAQLLPLVAQWKAEQQQQATASRGPNALGIGLGLLGAAGIGAAGLGLYNQLRRAGLSEEVAAQTARELEVQARATQPIPPLDPQRANPRPARPGGPVLRADGRPSAVVQDSPAPGVTRGSARARASGQYRARSEAGFHNPALASLQTPEQREAFLQAVAQAQGADSPLFRQTLDAVRAMETTTPTSGVVYPLRLLDGLTPQQRYGTTTAAEIAAKGGSIATSRTKANVSSQAGYVPRDSAPQFKALTYDHNADLRTLLRAAANDSPTDRGATLANVSEPLSPGLAREASPRYPTGIDASKASVFYLDSNDTLKPYIGGEPIYGQPPKPGEPPPLIYSGRRADGSPIRESDLRYLPNDDLSFYLRSTKSVPGLTTADFADKPELAALFANRPDRVLYWTNEGQAHPALELENIAANDQERPELRTVEREDQGIKGLMEPLPASDPRFYAGISKSAGVNDNHVFGAVSGQRTATGWVPDAPTPLDLSDFQSEVLRGSPSLIAGDRLRRAISDYTSTTGRSVPDATVHQWADALARQHGSDPAAVLQVAYGTVGRQGPKSPPRFTAENSARALAAGTGDALDRVYSSLGMHANATEGDLVQMVRSGRIQQAAESLANELPDLTRVFGTYLPSFTQDEKLSVVAEGVAAGLKDLSTAVTKYPEEAEMFGIGKPNGGFSVDGFLKSYVRDWVTARALQLDPSGQPTYRVPADAFELVALDARDNNRSTIEELESRIAGSSDGITAALRLDRLVSSAQSTKEGDPNNNATRFAQMVFDAADDDLVSTAMVKESKSDVRLSFSSRMRDDATRGFYDGNPSESDIDNRLFDYGSIPSGNSTLQQKLRGTDARSNQYDAVAQDVQEKQQWLTANAEALERERINLNRGLVSTPQGLVSAGRGLVISSGRRGAFLSGDTTGVNTSFREETFNDEELLPLDRQQDIEREQAVTAPMAADPTEAELAIQRPAASIGQGLVAGSARGELPALSQQGFPFVPATEAEATARQYAGSKLFFKNLGANSYGAMPAGEAFAPRRDLRAYFAEQAATRRSNAALAQLLQSSALGGSTTTSPFRTLLTGGRLEMNPAAIGGRGDLGSSPLRVEVEPGIWLRADALTGAQLAAAGAAPIPPPGPGIDPYGTYGERGLRSVERPPADPFIGIGIAPRSEIASAGSPETATALDSYLDARKTGRPGRGSERFSDDSNRRDAIALASGYVDAVRQANQAMHQQAMADGTERNGVLTPGQVAPPVVRPPLQYDSGELSGEGRRGSTFVQEPIAAVAGSRELVELDMAARQGSLPPAAQERLNTLRQELEPAVPAAPTDAELAAARNQHLADFITKVATPGFNSAGAQTSGWAGGDSWSGGARQAGRAAEARTYAAPSEALQRAIAFTARRRGGL